MNLCLGGNGELFVIDLDRVCFFLADDHYAHVYYNTNAHFMVPFGLSKLEKCIKEFCGEQNFLIRIGRKYIINIKKVFYVNLLRKEVLLTCIVGKKYVVNVSKDGVKILMEQVKNFYFYRTNSKFVL